MMVLDKNFREFIELLNVQDLADADNLEKLKKKKE